MASQTASVLDYLKRFGSITPMEAVSSLYCWRLGARIYELRQDGHDIHTELMTVTGRDGTTSHPARYHYKGAKQC